ncbi:MAG: hypothetical protein Harvfovirus27_19 [Harvfovirus sp.]|uniref:Uncharacterized protein n=1 Tax=Harvfovirus sp. TaxID=2487768 RepID=A0A3G5A2H4_9VIRU|nr:MAG: hypothetical protein Harvfovirus27_19 [Harvfovirus sp.]
MPCHNTNFMPQCSCQWEQYVDTNMFTNYSDSEILDKT